MIIIKAIACGLGRAAHDVFVAEQVHAGCGELPPTRRDKVWYWCRGLKDGFLDTLAASVIAPPFQRLPVSKGETNISYDQHSLIRTHSMHADSPFMKYRDILTNQSYSAAKALQDFTLSCYNGSLGQFRGDSIGNFDSQHFGIFLELVNYYRAHGENDPHLLSVGAAIWDKRREWGRKLLDQIAEHRSIKPSAYEEGSEREYWQQMEYLENQERIMREKGWINES